MRAIGFVGLGGMGMPMARNLREAGFQVVAFNRTRERADTFAAGGGRAAGQPGDAAATGLVVSMVADDRALDEVVRGADGILQGLPTGGLHVSMSTVSPALSRRMAVLHRERGSDYVAAPVFGRPEAAAARKLWICSAGTGRGRAREVFDALGQGVFDLGDEAGAANVVKLSGNFLIAAAMEAMAEAFALCEKNGVRRETAADLFASTLFSCPIYRNYGAAIAGERYSPPGFRLALGAKDMRLVLEAARESAVPMPAASLVHDRLLASAGRGRSDLDWSALALAVSEEAGLRK
jgi:3-hydroxyisobutyrate dehydrogenase-like beta-hydroxyacid dehydrogenase